MEIVGPVDHPVVQNFQQGSRKPNGAQTREWVILSSSVKRCHVVGSSFQGIKKICHAKEEIESKSFVEVTVM